MPVEMVEEKKALINMRDKTILDKIISKINQVQQKFLKDGFISKDQYNWINFDEYDTLKMDKDMMIDMIKDISY